MIDRITPDMVKAAYEKTGLKPARSGCLIGKTMACGAGVIAYQAMVAAGEQPADSEVVRRKAEELCGEAYIRAFISGFDGWERCGENQTGFTDGRACAAAVFQNANVSGNASVVS
jgi:hypothetical protein